MGTLDQDERIVTTRESGAETYPSEVIEALEAHKISATQALDQICRLRCFDVACRILAEELQKPWDYARYVEIRSVVLSHAKPAKDCGALTDIISLYIDEYKRYPVSFQLMCMCSAVSELVAINGKFPAKKCAASHFETIASLFKASQKWYNYLNALSILQEIQGITLSKSELCWLHDCALIRRERFRKELFCGQRPRDIEVVFEKMMKTAVDDSGEWAKDAMWDKLLSIVHAEGRSTQQFDQRFVAFLEKIDMGYAIEGDTLRVEQYKPTGVTATVYNIINRFKKPKESKRGVEDSHDNGVGTLAQPQILASGKKSGSRESVGTDQQRTTPKKKSVLFACRMRSKLRAFKSVYKRLERSYSDKHYDERSENMLREYKAEEEEVERRKRLLGSKLPVIEELVVEMEQKIAEIEATRKREREESVIEEAKRRKAEEDARNWRKAALDKRVKVEKKSTVEFEKPDLPAGAYRPPAAVYMRGNLGRDRGAPATLTSFRCEGESSSRSELKSSSDAISKTSSQEDNPPVSSWRAASRASDNTPRATAPSSVVPKTATENEKEALFQPRPLKPYKSLSESKSSVSWADIKKKGKNDTSKRQ